MGAIIGFLNGITSGVLAIIDFVSSLIADTLYVVQLLAQTVVQIPLYLSFLPAPVVSMIVSMFAVVVVYKILGRE